MRIREVKVDKKRYLPLLLLGDEQESMIDRYLGRGRMYILEGEAVMAQCVVTDEQNGVLELKNIATAPEYQRRGCAAMLIDFLAEKYSGDYSVLQVGTGEGTSTVSFYEKCGFSRSHTVKNFFVDNYDHPMYEDGVQLKDMLYLKRRL